MGKALQFISICPDELKKEILEGVSKQLENFKRDLPLKEQNEWLTRQEVARMLKIDLSTLYHWSKKGKLTAYGLSGRVYYKKHEVDAAIKKLVN